MEIGVLRHFIRRLHSGSKAFDFRVVRPSGLLKSCFTTSNSLVTLNASKFSRLPVISARQFSQKSAALFSDQKPEDGGEEKIPRPSELGKRKLQDNAKGRGPVGWANLAVTGVILCVLYVSYEYAKAKKEAERNKARKREVGKSKIGGTFDLIDHNGQPKTSEDFKGQWMLLYFGFTHCPDICPDEMEKLGEVYDLLVEQSKVEKQISVPVPIFITVDPERDGVKQINTYVKEFHPAIIGLTGPEDKIKDACKNYRVYFSAGPRSEDDDYIVDHTIIIYLIDPDGQFVDYYGQTKTSEEIARSCSLQMAKFESANKKSLIASLVN